MYHSIYPSGNVELQLQGNFQVKQIFSVLKNYNQTTCLYAINGSIWLELTLIEVFPQFQWFYLGRRIQLLLLRGLTSFFRRSSKTRQHNHSLQFYSHNMTQRLVFDISRRCEPRSCKTGRPTRARRDTLGLASHVHAMPYKPRSICFFQILGNHKLARRKRRLLGNDPCQHTQRKSPIQSVFLNFVIERYGHRQQKERNGRWF